MVFIDTVDCCTAAVNAPATSGENEFATSVNVGLRPLREKRSGGVLIKDLMKEYGLSKATVYRYLQTKAA
jgi:predicted transcriptional regulator